MSSEGSAEVEMEIILEAVEIESSEDPPMEEWPSLILKLPEKNRKRYQQGEGLYAPGSGELCAKYIAVSQSSVLRHPYYSYPAVLDPGILQALLKPEKPIVYPDDGQELYLAVCKDMNEMPVRCFLRGLLDEKIDLCYYGVNPHGVRAMAMALRFNKKVKSLNLTDNFLNDDACFHLGQMLLSNTTLKELNLNGCRIGPEGAKRLFANLVHNRGLVSLNLNRNQLGDAGVEYLTNAVSYGLDVREIYLSYNNISGKGLVPLAEAFDIHNKFTVIDLSWNNLFGVGTNTFFNALAESPVIQDVNLSWNSMCGARISLALKNLVRAPKLRILNLSNNKLEGEDISNLISPLGKAKKLVTLDLSYNPMSPKDAFRVINRMKYTAVKVQNVYMENVYIDNDSLAVLKHIRAMKAKQNTVITYGGIIDNTKPKGVDARELVLNRAEYLCKKPKKNPRDIALIVLEMGKRNIVKMNIKEFMEYIENTGAPMDEKLIEEFVNVFPGPKSTKTKFIDIRLLVDYVKRKWPDRKLPLTPPPEPEPEPPPVVETKAKGKGKGKGKK